MQGRLQEAGGSVGVFGLWWMMGWCGRGERGRGGKVRVSLPRVPHMLGGGGVSEEGLELGVSPRRRGGREGPSQSLVTSPPTQIKLCGTAG